MATRVVAERRAGSKTAFPTFETFQLTCYFEKLISDELKLNSN